MPVSLGLLSASRGCCLGRNHQNRQNLHHTHTLKNQEKGVVAKGVSVESSVTAKEAKVPKDIGPSSAFGAQSAKAKRGVHFCKTNVTCGKPLFLVLDTLTRNMSQDLPPGLKISSEIEISKRALRPLRTQREVKIADFLKVSN